jgi:predicted transcriptional regulator
MMGEYEEVASRFVELAGEQRLEILLKLQNNHNTKISAIAKELGATIPEVYRNFERLINADLISKNPDGSYSITAIGTTLCSYVSMVNFLIKNKKYFKSHDFGQLPEKFIQRFGSLDRGEAINGFVKVQEHCKEIYENAEQYIYNILFEVSYTPDLMELLIKKVSNGVKIRSIFSESAIIPKERKTVIDKFGFKEYIQQGVIERKMKSDVGTIVILNEKEAGVMFPSNGEVDVSKAFFSKDGAFHEWCLDYFNHSWDTSDVFREIKLKE